MALVLVMEKTGMSMEDVEFIRQFQNNDSYAGIHGLVVKTLD
jgi:hypothetical protein